MSNNKIFLLQTKYCNHQLKAWAFTNAIVFLVIIIINVILTFIMIITRKTIVSVSGKMNVK